MRDEIYAHGHRAWMVWLDEWSPMVAARIRKHQLTLAQGLALIGISGLPFATSHPPLPADALIDDIDDEPTQYTLDIT